MTNDALAEYNDARTEGEVVAVGAAIDSLLSAPAKVDFYSVAKATGVSRSTLYRNARLRAMVEAARDSQPDPWELVRQLRGENALLRGRLGEAGGRDAGSGKVEYALVALPCAA